MALIPLKNVVTIQPAGEKDRFNKPVLGTPYTLKSRFQQETALVVSPVGGDKEVVSSGHFIFDKLAAISYDDVLTYTDELGRTATYKPKRISVKSGLNGVALLTFVYV